MRLCKFHKQKQKVVTQRVYAPINFDTTFDMD